MIDRKEIKSYLLLRNYDGLLNETSGCCCSVYENEICDKYCEKCYPAIMNNHGEFIIPDEE